MSPGLAWTENTVIALQYSGRCPSAAINGYKLVNDMNWREILPINASPTKHGNNKRRQFNSYALQNKSLSFKLFTQHTYPIASAEAANIVLSLGFTFDNYRFLAHSANIELSEFEEVSGADESQQALFPSRTPKAAGAAVSLLVQKSTTLNATSSQTTIAIPNILMPATQNLTIMHRARL